MSFDDPVRRNGCRRDGKSPDDIVLWLRDRGTLMVNSGDQFVASDGERLLEGADEIERLRRALRKVESATGVSRSGLALVVREITRQALNGEA